MARKLTDQERANLETLREAMCRVLEPSLRNKAASVASSLVRVQGDVITDEDIAQLLKRHGKYRDALESAMRSTVLAPVEGSEGIYTLRLDGEAQALGADKPAEAEAQQAEADPATAPAAPEPTAEPSVVADSALEAKRASAPEGVEADLPQLDLPQVDPADEDDTTEAETIDAQAADLSDAASAESPDMAGSVDPLPADKDAQLEPEAAVVEDATAAAPTPGTRRARGRRLRGKPRRTTETSAPAKPTQLADVPYVRRGGPSETEVRSRILELDQRFWLNGWLLSHPGAYTLYERELIGINDALVNGALPGDITRRQLAYQMGGDEKFFEYGSDGHKLLRAMGMEDIIRHRPMPKPDLLYHAPRRRKHMRVLVTENLDPWLDVHDLMYEEGRTTILGERIHAVVLGGGTPVLEHNRLALLLDTLGADSLEVLYWGDIDRAGIDIMVRLRDVLGQQYPFAPFAPAYQLMVERAQERYPEPADNEQTGQVNIGMPDMSMLEEGLTEEAAAYARAVVEGCRLVPQEILTRRDL